MSKYLFISSQEGAKWGGSELLWASAASCLARRGHEVYASVKDWGSPTPQIESIRSTGCHATYRSSRYRIPPFFHRQVNRVFPPLPYCNRHLRSFGSDMELIVISQGDNSDGLEWMEAARPLGKKYAVIAHTAVLHRWPHDDQAERLAKSYDGAVRAYFVSQTVLNISRRQFASDLSNAKIIRNPYGVPYETRTEWPDDADDGLLLACIGRLELSSKGQDVLLQVLALPHWRQRRLRVSFVGTGPNERVLRCMAEQLRLKSVQFCGHSADVEEVFRNHHALVLPSRSEGMPVVVVEAMLCGRPCIATDVGGNRELICDGVNGFLAKAATVDLVDEALSRAWENRQRLREMGKAAAIKVRQWVSSDPTADFVQELESLVDGHR